MKAIRIHQVGLPEVMKLEEVPTPVPAAGEALVRLKAIGVNYIDVYHRLGWYPMPLPLIPGLEGAGIVEKLGPNVTEIQVGDRVAYAMAPRSYAEQVVVPAAGLVKLPTHLDFSNGAAAMLQGLTADYLVRGTFHLQRGQVALIHAAAGGVGLLAVQMAKQVGAKVIGTVSSPEKAALARNAGCDDVVNYSTQDFEKEVKRITDGKGCDVVYDSVGKTTFEKSLASLKPRGLLVLFGQASGPVPPFDPGVLSRMGSLFLTRPTLQHYTATRAELLERSERVFSALASGQLKLSIAKEIPLSEVVSAHQLLEGRTVSGKLLLIP